MKIFWRKAVLDLLYARPEIAVGGIIWIADVSRQNRLVSQVVRTSVREQVGDKIVDATELVGKHPGDAGGHVDGDSRVAIRATRRLSRPSVLAGKRRVLWTEDVTRERERVSRLHVHK